MANEFTPRCSHGFNDGFYCPDCGPHVNKYVTEKAHKIGIGTPSDKMVMRDVMAMNFMAQFVANADKKGILPGEKECAEAYALADLMLKVRSEKKDE